MAPNTGNPPSPTEFFNEEMATRYDERNSRLSPISDCMHFLFRLVLDGLPEKARILCVGVGTGSEILSLSKVFPDWRFVGVDPSAPMLDVCRTRLRGAGVMDRCELVQGEVHDIPEGEAFDAILSILVAHFISANDRPAFYQAVHQRLHAGGCFLSTEISFDLEAAAYPSMLENWGRIHTLMGATPDSLKALPDTLANTLTVMSPDETERHWKSAGFHQPVQFFQAFMMRGWHAQKPVR